MEQVEFNMRNVINKTITNIENNYIIPFASLNPILLLIHITNISNGEKSYIKSLIRAANKYGVNIQEEEANSPFEAIEIITEAKNNFKVQGIMIISDYGNMSRTLYDAIPLRLDIDGLSSYSLGKLFGSKNEFAYRQAPCTAIACLKVIQEIAAQNKFTLNGKKAAIIGRSIRVGRPLAEILLQQNMSVSIFHSYNTNFSAFDYDFIISAIGKPRFWDKDSLCVSKYSNVYFIDAGINLDENNHICGDFNPNIVEDTALSYLTPVPGGIGKVTTSVVFAKLFHNAANFFIEQQNVKKCCESFLVR